MLRRPVESAHYLSIRYTERLAQAGIEPSVGSAGDSYDNALAESIIGLYKAEEIRRRGPWKGVEEVEFAILEWVAWYNTRRLLEPLGYVPPDEFEQAYYRYQMAPAELVTLTQCALRQTRGGSPSRVERLPVVATDVIWGADHYLALTGRLGPAYAPHPLHAL